MGKKIITIFQLRDNDENRIRRFEGMDTLVKINEKPEFLNYEPVHTKVVDSNTSLNWIYEFYNVNCIEGFKGHSLSVSDMIVLEEEGKFSAHYVDSVGFAECPEFAKQHEEVIGSTKNDKVEDIEINIEEEQER